MDVDTESSSSKKTGEQQCSKRSNYFRGAQRRGNFNRYKYTSQQRANNNPTEELETNNNTHYNSTSDDVTSKFSALNVHKSNNFRGSNKQPFSRHQYNSSRLTDHRNFSKDHNASSNQAPCTVEQDSPESSYASNVPNLPQRGQIIGGRYIRKQSNQSHLNSSKGYRDFQPENSYERERNYNPRYQSNSSYKYRNSNNYHSESHEHTKKEETYGRHASDSSSEYSVHHNLPYQSREVKKRYTDSHSHKYQNYGSSSEEAANYKTNKFFKHKPSQNKSQNNDEDKATQRELLISRLNKAECECLVCCELIRTKDQIWHCLSCYHVLHLWCIKKWARSPAAAVEGGSWRCPACQSLYSDIPFSYLCFCGKSKNPEINYHLTPHTCGEICDRIRPDCSHHCKELCHPGPCPPCAVFVLKSCPCGKTTQTLPCNQNMESVCESLCDKVLNCGAHRCRSLCHDGKCLPCEEVVIQNMDVVPSNLEALYGCTKNSDMTIILKKQSYPVHKAILVARSDVFATMFQHDVEETNSGIIEITDCEPNSFKDFLLYIYTGKFENFSSNNVCHLYKAADKYNVQKLKALCVAYMERNISANNLFDIVTLANEFNEAKLISLTQEFFNRNTLEIIKSRCDDWKQFIKQNAVIANKLVIGKLKKTEVKN